MKRNVLNLLGLANRAGFLVTGEDSVIKALQSKIAKLVIVANDASEQTKKRFVDKCFYYGIETVLLFDSLELYKALGKNRKIIALTDKGFYTAIIKCIRGEKNEI